MASSASDASPVQEAGRPAPVSPTSGLKAAPPSRPQSDAINLPHGHCTFILLNPEIKGQRCACLGFTLNHALPGVLCECGHLSCYHHTTKADRDKDRDEVEALRKRIAALEGQLDSDNHVGFGSTLRTVIQRLSDLEEQTERNRDETSQDMRDCYGNVTRVWQSVQHLERRQGAYENRSIVYDERLDGHADTLQRLGDRLMAYDEASIALEERVEALEEEDYDSPRLGRHRRRSTSDSEQSKNYGRTVTQRTRVTRDVDDRGMMQATAALARGIGGAIIPTGWMPGSSWTVHVSLLPTASQPFPFEKDTTAYKRCLSRGLHQMLAVGGTDSASFSAAVSRSFGRLLKGRAWVPLQARLCDAVTLEGLPMLRPLESALVSGSYDFDFLRRYCAVCSATGKIESLYIAMLSDTFSWQFLRRSPCHLEGLEECWAYDALLDREDQVEDSLDDRAAGDIMPTMTSLKRSASEMSRAANLSPGAGGAGGGEGCSGSGGGGSSGSSEGARPKLPRTSACIQAPMEVRGRCGVETI
ncbi:hypothetical protein F4778DRAFT_775962 [Xylariomycetidae sp. FL2044]|nr:hypothetical protein F4778DRAFT_775962 [Xylariomycetidae sp. FL2044]